jgi:hypothetical protein
MMRNRVFVLWIVAALVVLGACEPAVEGNPVVPSATGLSATLEAPVRLPDGDTVIVQFTLTNNSDVDLYVLKWYTPLEGIGGEIFRVERDGQAVPYTGILATRGDPTPEGYQRLEAGQSASAEVDLATSFDFSQPGEYTIEFLSPRISHVARSEAEMARSVDDLGPVDIPANTVTAKVGGSSVEPTAGDHLVHYQGASPYDKYTPPFEIDYSVSLWEFVPGDGFARTDQLRHRHIAGCSLRLGEGPAGASPVSTVNLAGYDWRVFQVRPKLLHYSTLRDNSSFLFGLRLPDPYKDSAMDPCQQAAEDVLKTLGVASWPLPHSMKGYELYSWYEANEDTWYYTLITGTNRLKTFEEVLAGQKVAIMDGWVSITVKGDGSLKAELRRLPKGEQVTWVGPEWLKQVGADEEMVRAIKLPDRATAAELETFCRELGVDLHTTATQAPMSGPEPAPALTVLPEGTGQDTGAQQLVIREWPIVAPEIDNPGHLEYDDRLGDEILARIKALRDQSAERSLALTNEALAPFGYRLESRFDDDWNRNFYDLYREDEAEPLLPGLSPIWPAFINASVNASGTDFVLVAENAPNTNPWNLLVDSDGVQAWDPLASGPFPPAYVSDALARITATGDLTITYQVELDGRAIYTGAAIAYGAYMPLRSFTTWDGHWVLEVDDHLIMDGQDIGQTLGYDAAFGFAQIGGQPFYFFEQNGLVGISYGGQVLPNLYEQVFHNRCCEAAIHNVEAGPEAVWFHALRDGVWYWVEARALASSEKADQAGEELALQSLVDYFEHLRAGRYEEASQLYGGSYEVLIDNNPTLDPEDHAALWRNACTSNGFQCLRVRSARLQADVSSEAEYRFVVEFSTPDDQLFVRGSCCGASETDMPPQSEFLFAVVRSEDGVYRVQDLPVYVP